MAEKIKWYSVAEYVDIWTGEIISKSLFEREYTKLRSNKSTKTYRDEKQRKYGIIKHTIECERRRQQRIEF